MFAGQENGEAMFGSQGLGGLACGKWSGGGRQKAILQPARQKLLLPWKAADSGGFSMLVLDRTLVYILLKCLQVFPLKMRGHDLPQVRNLH